MPEKPSLPLACPRCATRYSLDERFCAECGMPLTYAGKVDVEEPAHGARERARKVNPEYTRGDLRRVATARHQPEAELIQMMLLEEGIPSTLRRSAGFDVPDFLAAGPRDVMVPESGVALAREILQEAEMSTAAPAPEPGSPTGTSTVRPAMALALWLIAGSALLGLLILIVLALND
jgi:hypothetical protein